MKCLMFGKALYCKHTHLLGVIYHLTTINIAKINIEFKKIFYLLQTIYLLKSIQGHRPPQSRHFVDLPSTDIQTFLGQRKSVCLPVHHIVSSWQRVVIQWSFWDNQAPFVPLIKTHYTHLLLRYLSNTRKNVGFQAAFIQIW